ncbi:hypothetical protein ONZ45_g2248 [Pleurotus djamor]|nr:hypothetical protein ONZ45_g2248 [Pleurotus djamor]
MVTAPSSPYYSPDTKIVLITPPPINTHQRRADLESRDPPLALDRLFEVTKSYAEAVKEVASQEKVAVIDVWTAFWEASGKDEQNLGKVMDDGLHPNAKGHDIVFGALIKTIAEEYPELHYDKLKPVFPPWAEIDWSNPGPSLRASKVD